MNWIHENCEELDATVFSSDALTVPDQRKELKEYCMRWLREIESWENLESE